MPAFQLSLSEGAKHHPFPQEALAKIRSFILPGHGQPASGQPFYLDIIKHLLLSCGDPDHAFQDVLVKGVPLGVETPTLRTGRMALEVRALR